MSTRKPLVLQDGQLAQLQSGDTLVDVLYSLGGHNVSELTNDAGYLETETDPVWAAWLASTTGGPHTSSGSFLSDVGWAANNLGYITETWFDTFISNASFAPMSALSNSSAWDGAASWVNYNGDAAASAANTVSYNSSAWDGAASWVNYNGYAAASAANTVSYNSSAWDGAASWVYYNQTAVGYLLSNWGSTMNNSSNWDSVYGWYLGNMWSGHSPSDFVPTNGMCTLYDTMGGPAVNWSFRYLTDALGHESINWGDRELRGGWDGSLVAASWGTGTLYDGSNRKFLVNAATNGGFAMAGGYASYSDSLALGANSTVFQPNGYAFGQNLSLYSGIGTPVLALGQNIMVSGPNWVTALGVFAMGISVPSSNTVVLGGFSGSADEIWLTANTNGVYDKNGNQFVTGTPWLDLGNMNGIVDCNGLWGGYSESSVGIQLQMGAGQLMPGGTSSPTLDWVNKYLYGTWTDGLGNTYVTTATGSGYNNSNWDSVYNWYYMSMWGGSSPSSFATATQGMEADSLNMTWGMYTPSSFATAMQGSEADSLSMTWGMYSPSSFATSMQGSEADYLSMTWSGYSPSSFASAMGYNNSNWDSVYSTWGSYYPSDFLPATPTYLDLVDANGIGITTDSYGGIHTSASGILWIDGDSIYVQYYGSTALMIGYGYMGGNTYHSMVSGPWCLLGIDFSGGTLISNSAGIVANWSTGTLTDGSGNAFLTGTPWTAEGYLTTESDPVFSAWLASGSAPFADNSGGANWVTSAPTNTTDAINRIAAAVAGLLGTPIP